MADNKAAVVLTTLAVGFSVLGAGLLAGDFSPAKLYSPARGLFWCGVVVALASVVAAASALWPRFTNKDMAGGVYYWGHIAAFADTPSAIEAMKGTNYTAAERTTHQLWRLSRLVARKYHRVRVALILASIAAALIGIALLVQEVHKH